MSYGRYRLRLREEAALGWQLCSMCWDLVPLVLGNGKLVGEVFLWGHGGQDSPVEDVFFRCTGQRDVGDGVAPTLCHVLHCSTRGDQR